jgi:hypothetical protein|tara:strand:- start:462 stop:1115 length:654 start_codon:yes stop_codon:yes gene_type:complete
MKRMYANTAIRKKTSDRRFLVVPFLNAFVLICATMHFCFASLLGTSDKLFLGVRAEELTRVQEERDENQSLLDTWGDDNGDDGQQQKQRRDNNIELRSSLTILPLDDDNNTDSSSNLGNTQRVNGKHEVCFGLDRSPECEMVDVDWDGKLSGIDEPGPWIKVEYLESRYKDGSTVWTKSGKDSLVRVCFACVIFKIVFFDFHHFFFSVFFCFLLSFY